MSTQQIRSLFALTLVAVPILLTDTAECGESKRQAGRHLQSVRHFANTVLEHGRDVYGDIRSPLFVDGLHVETMKPATWKWLNDEEWVLCNFASQQSLMRLLDGLTALTGEKKYRREAENAARYALEKLRAPSGYLYWGGHTAWDLKADLPVGTWYGRGSPDNPRFNHELKVHQPYFELMWRVNPDAARRAAEMVWAGHILDWSRLDYNRHAKTSDAVEPQWDHDFIEDIEVPFPAKGNNLSFCCVTPPLIRSGTALATLGQDDKALTWTRRLVHRWQQGRHSKTGLCGSLLSYRTKDRAQEAFAHIHPNICEAKIASQGSRYNMLPLAQMQAAGSLLARGGKYAEVGQEFVNWASEDLKTLAKYCYEEKQGHFVVKLTDGTPLNWQQAKPGYFIAANFAPSKPNALTFWAYALAYRMTKDEVHWRMLRKLGTQLGLGDLGDPHTEKRKLRPGMKSGSWMMIYALLELQKATDDGAFLKLACHIGDQLLAMQSKTGLFPRPEKTYPKDGTAVPHAIVPGTEHPAREYACTGDEIPLALLHLAAATENKSLSLPQPMLDNHYFHCPYHAPLADYQQKRDDTRTYDWLVFYGSLD